MYTFKTFICHNYIYLLLLKEFKFKGQISPFSVEKDKIKSLIINKNKMKYLKKIENELIISEVFLKDIFINQYIGIIKKNMYRVGTNHLYFDINFPHFSSLSYKIPS